MPIEVLLGALAGGIVASVGWWVLLRWSMSEREEAMEGQERARRRQTQIEEEMLALEHLFAGMLDAVPRPVFVTNRDRVILQVNRAAVELAHLPRHQVVGRIVATVIQDYAEASARAARQASRAQTAIATNAPAEAGDERS